VTLRTEVDNPNEVLLPGMFVRVVIDQGINKQAILIPPQALQRGTDGKNFVMTVVDNKVVTTIVETGSTYQGRIIVNSGLTAGAQLIVEGFQKVRTGSPVKTAEWKASSSTTAK